MDLITWNINTALFFALIVIPFLGILMGESRLKRMIFAIFVGIVVSQALSGIAFNFLSRYNLEYVTQERVGFLLFALSIFLLNIGPLATQKTSQRFSIRVLVLSALMTVLLVSVTLQFLPDGVRDNALDQSLILSFISSTRLVWIGASAAWVIILNLWPQHDPKKK